MIYYAMNCCELSIEIIGEVDYKFMIYSKNHSAIARFRGRVSEKAVLDFVAYDNIADAIYRLDTPYIAIVGMLYTKDIILPYKKESIFEGYKKGFYYKAKRYRRKIADFNRIEKIEKNRDRQIERKFVIHVLEFYQTDGKLIGNYECERGKKLQEVTIYTDGACSGNPGVGGWAAVLIFNVKNEKQNIIYIKEISGAKENTTNNEMELKAVYKAVNALSKPCSITICTDSNYVYQAFECGWIEKWKSNNWRTSSGQVKNLKLWQDICKLLEKHEYKFVKVKGHDNVKYNERCDKLAKAEIVELTKELEEDVARVKEMKDIMNEASSKSEDEIIQQDLPF